MVDATAGMALDTMLCARISMRAAVETTSESTFGGTLAMTSVPIFETMIGHLVGHVVIEAARVTTTLTMRGTGVGRIIDTTAVRTPHLMIQRKVDTGVSQDYSQEVERRHDGSIHSSPWSRVESHILRIDGTLVDRMMRGFLGDLVAKMTLRTNGSQMDR